jgi:asparagine synthase (glutamine-hydrolysing)
MTGILPPVIQWRRDKLDFTPHLVSGMLSEGRHKVEEVLGTDVLAGYADLQALRNAWYRIVSRPEAADGLEVQAVWRAVSVGNWLRDPQGRDVELRVA